MSAIDSRDSLYSITRNNGAAAPVGAAPTLPVQQESDGDTDRSAAAGGRVALGQSGGLLQGVLKTLNALGLKPSGQVGAAVSVGTTDPDGDTDGSASVMSQGVRQALNGFMHDLFQTLGELNGQGAGKPQAAARQAAAAGADVRAALQSAYGDLPNNLQNLAGTLKADAGANIGNAARLETSFRELVGAIVGNRNGGNQAVPAETDGTDEPSLPSFLLSLGGILSAQSGPEEPFPDKAGALFDRMV